MTPEWLKHFWMIYRTTQSLWGRQSLRKPVLITDMLGSSAGVLNMAIILAINSKASQRQNYDGDEVVTLLWNTSVLSPWFCPAICLPNQQRPMQGSDPVPTKFSLNQEKTPLKCLMWIGGLEKSILEYLNFKKSSVPKKTPDLQVGYFSEPGS